MTLTYTLQIWNEDADLPSGESSAHDDSSAPDESFASALTSLESACDNAEGDGAEGSSSFKSVFSRPRERNSTRGQERVCGRPRHLANPSPPPSEQSRSSSPSPSPDISPVRSQQAFGLSSPLWSEPASEDSLAITCADTPLVIDTEEHPPPDEVVGDDTTEWHDDYSDTSWADSERDLSTLWDVPSFDQDSELDGDADCDNGWESTVSQPPSILNSEPSKHTVPPQVFNMFRRPEGACDNTWHAHVEPTPPPRVPTSAASTDPGHLAQDLSRHSQSFRSWCPSAVINRTPFATLDTIQESNSRGNSPRPGAPPRCLRPRSRSHSSARAREIIYEARKQGRSRSGSATGRLELVMDTKANEWDGDDPVSSAWAMGSTAAGSWSLSLDEDTRRVLARFQGFRPFRQAPPELQTQGQEGYLTREQRLQPVNQFMFSWPQNKLGGMMADKVSPFAEQGVLVDESLLSNKDRARYRRHLRRLRLRSARLLDFTSDSDDLSDVEDGSTTASILPNSKRSDPLMSSD